MSAGDEAPVVPTPGLVVLASGGGTNCQAILDACARGDLDARVLAVITNRAGAGVVERAHRAGVSVEIVSHESSSPADRRRDDARLAEVIARYGPALVVLAGWMRLLTSELCSRFDIVNLHPALPGEFPGLHAIERAHEAWRQGETHRSGVMIHRVPDEAVDAGPVLATREVAFVAGDTLDTFEHRMHLAEHELIVEGIAAALASQPSPGHSPHTNTVGASS